MDKSSEEVYFDVFGFRDNSVKELIRQVSLGPIEYYGVSNFGPDNLENFVEAFTGYQTVANWLPITNQIDYNLLWRFVGHEVIPYPYINSFGTSSLTYSLPLDLLSGQFHKVDHVLMGLRGGILFSTVSFQLARQIVIDGVVKEALEMCISSRQEDAIVILKATVDLTGLEDDIEAKTFEHKILKPASKSSSKGAAKLASTPVAKSTLISALNKVGKSVLAELSQGEIVKRIEQCFRSGKQQSMGTSAKSATAKAIKNTGKIFPGFPGFKKLNITVAIAWEGVFLTKTLYDLQTDENMENEEKRRSTTKEISSSIMGLIGGVIGQGLIPIPIIGPVAGSIVGGMIGGAIGEGGFSIYKYYRKDDDNKQKKRKE